MKKLPSLAAPVEFGSWAAARFQNENDRDQFLGVFVTPLTSAVEAVSMPGEDRGALVRWRPGHFLGLNDVAYAYGGRIILPMTRRRRA